MVCRSVVVTTRVESPPGTLFFLCPFLPALSQARALPPRQLHLYEAVVYNYAQTELEAHDACAVGA